MLTGKQRSFLRGEANNLDPYVHIGKEGLNEAVYEKIDEVLDDHELVKIRVLDNSLEDINEVAHEVCDQLGAELVQVIGNVFIIFRRNMEEPVYNLP
ncbi:MAG TPA: ribosome assembly RNA-binding protein YhbY [Halanaerobiales bacterium]|nr:ribosome assembly RNA-binding protein YhbY [Halanaerobiales bacterium]